MNPLSSIAAAITAGALLAIFSPSPTVASPRPADGATAYTIDAEHSSVLFRVKHLNCSYTYGRFNKFSGSFTLDEKAPASSSISMEVQADSVDTNSEGRDKHLRSTDFFSAKEFPTLSFVSTSVAKAGDHEFEVKGDMTIRGVKKPVTLKAVHTGKAKDPRAGERAGFEAIFTVQRGDFGVKYGAGAIGEDVQVTISVEGILQKAK